MTDIQAALGASQMRKLDAFASRRRALADLYDRALAGLPLRPLARDPKAVNGWHLYMIRLDLRASKRRAGKFSKACVQRISE